MSKTSVQVWNYGDIQKVEIHKNGTINKNAIKSFSNGQCHSLAIAISMLTKCKIYGVCDCNNAPSDPGHLVVKHPKTGAYIDILGPGAVGRWRKKWGVVTLHELTVKQAKNLDSYLRPNVKAAKPFAKKIVEKYWK